MTFFLKKYLIFCFVLLIPIICDAQTVNQGMFSVEPGTQLSTIEKFKNDVSGDFVNDGELFLYNHFENDGYFGFSPNLSSGIVRFRGQQGYQNIVGNLPIDLNNVEFNNVSDKYAFRVSNDIAVFGKVDFQKGIVKSDPLLGSLVFEDGATCFNADDDSYVEGLVEKKGNDSFVFPIGQNSKYRLAGITAPETINDAYTQKYVLDNPNAIYPFSNKEASIEVINNKEYWVFERVAGKADVILTLSWDETTTPSELTSGSDESLHIVRWDANKKLWVDQGGVVDKGDKTVTSPVEVTGYGVFTIARVVDSSSDNIIVNNAISPNGDGKNDYLKFQGLIGEDNTVEIYNRWGTKVYETKAYDTNGNVFSGYSESSMTIDKSAKLPVGTYFYVLTYKKSGKTTKKVGYLYINL
ncbi:gliding motility-associated C-terminal domain-containing protein [Flavobacterium succinicans]|uniref:Gliding motility-associated C-terminal domain-containing protein n=1 Tax=Flavobacterium succinicans TaxID=29536 RepID=A0A199XT50_9FLAO|nr:gliding motility-associated C-terminal domain-containing protein [Flavobacterium succinicans]OAZ04509.1 hypothetical protein FLB_10930 [Flavobacterium succinicans]